MSTQAKPAKRPSLPDTKCTSRKKGRGRVWQAGWLAGRGEVGVGDGGWGIRLTESDEEGEEEAVSGY